MKNKDELLIIKYPIRFIVQLTMLILIAWFIFSFIKGNMRFEEFGLYFVFTITSEIFIIIYLIRNKTFYMIKDNKKYMIRRKDLITKNQRKNSEDLIVDHYRFDDKEIDILNFLDLLLSFPSKNKLEKNIKDKVYTYSKYQITNINCKFNFIGIKCYEVSFKNNELKRIITFNKL